MSRRAKVWLVVALSALVFAGSAIAYYVFFENGKGTTSPVTIGTVPNSGQELELSGTIAAITEPGKEGEITVKVKNNSTTTQKIAKIDGTVVVGEPYLKNGCKTEWFSLRTSEASPVYEEKGLTTPLTIPVGESTIPNKYWMLDFNSSGSENQDACSGASVTVAMTSTP